MNTCIDNPGMDGLLHSSMDAKKPSTISTLQMKAMATVDNMLKPSRNEVKRLSTNNNKIESEIASRQDAGEEVDHRNIVVQAILGAKEGGSYQRFTIKLGKNITDCVLLTANGPQYKLIDDYDLCKIIAAAFQNADRPDSNGILRQLAYIFSFTFDHTKTDNENIRTQCAHLQSHGITITKPQQATILLAKTTANEDYGQEFRPALQTIRRQYKYLYVHDKTLIKMVLRNVPSPMQFKKCRTP